MTWIKHRYTCHVEEGEYVCDIPYIQIELSHGDKAVYARGLIDSGCTVTNINLEVAQILGIDLTSSKTLSIIGATGQKSGHVSQVDMWVKDHGEKFKSPAIFVEDLPVAVLLGQDNFFEKYNIKFEKHRNTFGLSRVSKKN